MSPKGVVEGIVKIVLNASFVYFHVFGQSSRYFHTIIIAVAKMLLFAEDESVRAVFQK